MRSLTLGAAFAACCVAAPVPPPVARSGQTADGDRGNRSAIDGQIAEGILEVGGVAMAADGTGGIVYRKIVDGRAHVFAAQHVGRALAPAAAPRRGPGFDSSWPRIAAGTGGRLVAIWVQEFGADSDRLFSAIARPGGDAASSRRCRST